MHSQLVHSSLPSSGCRLVRLTGRPPKTGGRAGRPLRLFYVRCFIHLIFPNIERFLRWASQMGPSNRDRTASQAMRIGYILPYDPIDSPLDNGRCRFWGSRRCFRVFWPHSTPSTHRAGPPAGRVIPSITPCVLRRPCASMGPACSGRRLHASLWVSWSLISTMETRPFHEETAYAPDRPATRWRNCEGVKRA